MKNAGGFRLLLAKETCRKELYVVSHGSCDAEQLRCFGTGRIHVRPLQVGIALAISLNTSVEYKECLTCHLLVPISEMQQHIKVSHVSTKITSTCYWSRKIYCIILTIFSTHIKIQDSNNGGKQDDTIGESNGEIDILRCVSFHEETFYVFFNIYKD